MKRNEEWKGTDCLKKQYNGTINILKNMGNE